MFDTKNFVHIHEVVVSENAIRVLIAWKIDDIPGAGRGQNEAWYEVRSVEGILEDDFPMPLRHAGGFLLRRIVAIRDRVRAGVPIEFPVDVYSTDHNLKPL